MRLGRFIVCAMTFACAVSSANGHPCNDRTQPSSDSVARCTAWLSRSPDDAEALLGRGEAYIGAGNFDAAVADLTRAIQLAESSPEKSRIQPYALTRRGDAYLSKKETDPAIADYTEVISRSPTNLFAFAGRARAQEVKGNGALAIADSSEAIKISANLSSAYVIRADARQADGDYKGAIADYTKALGLPIENQNAPPLSPKTAGVLIRRGNAYHKLKDDRRALSDYSKAIRRDPNYADAYRQRATVYAGRHDTARAKADMAKAARLESPTPRD